MRFWNGYPSARVRGCKLFIGLHSYCYLVSCRAWGIILKSFLELFLNAICICLVHLIWDSTSLPSRPTYLPTLPLTFFRCRIQSSACSEFESEEDRISNGGKADPIRQQMQSAAQQTPSRSTSDISVWRTRGNLQKLKTAKTPVDSREWDDNQRRSQ